MLIDKGATFAHLRDLGGLGKALQSLWKVSEKSTKFLRNECLESHFHSPTGGMRVCIPGYFASPVQNKLFSSMNALLSWENRFLLHLLAQSRVLPGPALAGLANWQPTTVCWKGRHTQPAAGGKRRSNVGAERWPLLGTLEEQLGGELL